MRELLHICGPISIYSFGVAIAVGLLAFIKGVQAHPQFKELKLEGKFTEILILGIASALIGGRFLFAISEPEGLSALPELFMPWKGGLSLLGGIIAVLLVVPWYLKRIRVPVLPFFDLIAIYTPLLQSIARIGCFLAGCCHGAPTNGSWGYTYTDPASAAPIGIPLYPTQIYSAVALFIIFILLYGVFQYRCRKPGQLTALYLMLASVERFAIDFLRGDRTMVTSLLSVSQITAIALFTVSFIALTRISLSRKS